MYNNYNHPAVSNNWIDAIKTTEIDSANNKIKEVNTELRNKILFMQGLVLELQRTAGKTENFDRSVYNNTVNAGKYLENLVDELKRFNEQIEYTKDIVDSIKISQELSEGFEKPRDYDFSSLNIGSAISATLPAIASSSHTHSNGWVGGVTDKMKLDMFNIDAVTNCFKTISDSHTIKTKEDV